MAKTNQIECWVCRKSIPLSQSKGAADGSPLCAECWEDRYGQERIMEAELGNERNIFMCEFGPRHTIRVLVRGPVTETVLSTVEHFIAVQRELLSKAPIPITRAMADKPNG